MTPLLFDDIAVGDSLPPLGLDVTTTAIIVGAMASRDYSPLHHDYHYAREEAGHKDIFLNTPHQAALFQRFLGERFGPRMRLGRMQFAMKHSVYAGAALELHGLLESKLVDEAGCGWLSLHLRLMVGEQTATECTARCALPLDESDNPWQRRGEDWRP